MSMLRAGQVPGSGICQTAVRVVFQKKRSIAVIDLAKSFLAFFHGQLQWIVTFEYSVVRFDHERVQCGALLVRYKSSMVQAGKPPKTSRRRDDQRACGCEYPEGTDCPRPQGITNDGLTCTEELRWLALTQHGSVCTSVRTLTTIKAHRANNPLYGQMGFDAAGVG